MRWPPLCLFVVRHAQAFGNLASLRALPQDFAPTKSDGTTFTDSVGIPLWLQQGSVLGGGHEFGFVPVSFAPNPVGCVWIGPYVGNFSCSTCVLGYERTSAENGTCVQPAFRPHGGWEGSAEQSGLTLRDTRGVTVRRNVRTNALILLTKVTYTIPGPQLEPKETMFAGYKLPHTKIRYELDFSRGADVDFGCGTTAVGDGSGDVPIPKDVYAHPTSMQRVNHQWIFGRPNPSTGDPGYYAYKCPRYHRFTVTKPGNFTFDTCASAMNVAISIYKRTNNLTASEPCINSSDGSIQRGLLYVQSFQPPLCCAMGGDINFVCLRSGATVPGQRSGLVIKRSQHQSRKTHQKAPLFWCFGVLVLQVRGPAARQQPPARGHLTLQPCTVQWGWG